MSEQGDMRLFFFDVQDGRMTIDYVGMTLADLQAAREQAFAVLRRIAERRVADSDEEALSVTVYGDGRQPIFKASLCLRYEGICTDAFGVRPD